MIQNIWMDDKNEPMGLPRDEWVWLRDAEQVKGRLLHTPDSVDIISMDANLGHGNLRGIDLLKWMRETKNLPKKGLCFHSFSLIDVRDMQVFTELYLPFKEDGNIDVGYKTIPFFKRED